MTTPKVIKKNGKRYVTFGKKRIKVDNDISERELIKWMIKHFKPRRRIKKKAKDDWTAPPPSKAIILPAFNVAVTDLARIQAREAKDKLEEVQKKLAEVEKKALPAPAPPALPAPSRPAIEEKEREKKDDSDRLPEYSKEEIRQGIQMIKDKEKANRLLKMELKTEKQQKAAEAIKRRALQREKLEVKKEDTKGIMTASLKKAIHANAKKVIEAKYKAGTTVPNGLRSYMKELGLKQPENPDKESLINALVAANKNYLNEDEAAADVDAIYNPQLEKIDEDIEELDKGDAEDMEIIQQGSGNIPDEGLSELDINKAMKGHRQFLGTIAADEISLLKPGKEKRVCWIMNTDPRAKGGTHWVAFFIDARPHGTQSVEYYDPLADPISAAFLANVKLVIKQVHGSDSYLKFRENKIADQSETSNNCGPFCIRFLQARLAGESFAKATGWDKAGEKNIEIWKKHPKQQLWISGQTGEGLRDIFAAIKKGATKIYDRIKATLSGPRGGAPPAVRGWLAKYGDTEIQQVWVCKKPIYSIIESIGNWLSQGKLRENMDRLGYDRMMHLYMIVQLKNGPTVKIEKNHVVEIKNSGDLGQRHMSTGHPSTVAAMIKQAEAGHGEAVWKYHLVDANCQKFIMWCLGTHASAGVRDFVQQDVEESLKDMGLFKKIATVVTDVAGAADVAMNGAGPRSAPRAPASLASSVAV